MKKLGLSWIPIVAGLLFIIGLGIYFISLVLPKKYSLPNLSLDYNKKIPLECKTRGTWIGMRNECDFLNFPTKSDGNKSWCKGNLGEYSETYGDTGPEDAKCFFKLWKFEN